MTGPFALLHSVMLATTGSKAAETSPVVGVPLVIGLAALVALTIAVSWWGRLGIERESLVAVARAVLQLAVVSTVIAVVMQHWWSAMAFAGLMFAVAVYTAGGRIGARRDWPWLALAMGMSAAIVLTIIYGSGASPFTGPAIISISGIVIGNTMTVIGLAGRRFFEALGDDVGQVEAALSLGFARPDAINLVIERRAALALGPVLDQTSTVGLVTLPGAFVGVLLGGGSAAQAAASQILVLVGIIATQTLAVTTLRRLVAAGKVMSPTVRASLPSA